MSKDIKDIAYWKEEYPFLNNMVAAYEEFNSAVIDDSSTIESHMTVLKSWGWYEEKHKDIYKKLTRNLLLLLNREYKKMSNTDFCRYLYQWVYHTKKKYDINEFNISLFYQAIHDRIVQLGAIKKCPYFSYDNDYEKSTNIIKLQNFYNNIDAIAEVLMNKSLPQEKDSHYCYAQRYANECVNIYKKMHDIYCSDKKDENTCSELNTFYTSYTQFLFTKEDIKNKIPNLASGEIEKNFGCPSDKTAPGSVLIQESGPEQGMRTESGPRHGSVSVEVEKQNNPTKFNSTAVVGTMAGIPPFLALLYKFTPAGTLFRPKNKKSINAFNHLDEEIEKELFYRRHENATINSSPEKYNVVHGPA
ncbi:VIR protein [Plasmodium vivax]|uniref:VIR protein n=1 Tax=Plasmodium vivax TaxID=5855 RepID=A0A1G4HDT3_PLAVI|nr:VIR protein [Plasmodium vivax]